MDVQDVRVITAIWRLTRGEKRGQPDADFLSRELILTPFGGAYGLAGVTLCVNGSPPRGLVIVKTGIGAGLRFGSADVVVFQQWRPAASVLRTWGYRANGWRFEEARVILEFVQRGVRGWQSE